MGGTFYRSMDNWRCNLREHNRRASSPLGPAENLTQSPTRPVTAVNASATSAPPQETAPSSCPTPASENSTRPRKSRARRRHPFTNGLRRGCRKIYSLHTLVMAKLNHDVGFKISIFTIRANPSPKCAGCSDIPIWNAPQNGDYLTAC